MREAARQGRTVLLSSHVLSEVDRLCASVPIIKDGRTIEQGRLADMRHLAASWVTATIPARAVDAVQSRLAAAGGVTGTCDPAGRVDAQVTAEAVPAALRALLDAGATQLTCTPATLDDLFLRYYAVAAR